MLKGSSAVRIRRRCEIVAVDASGIDPSPERLAPAILVNDIGQRDPANRPEPSHRIADRQQGIRMDTGWKAQSGFRFVLELQVQRRQSRAEAEGSRI